MKYLLDVNVLISGIWMENPLYARATSWLDGKDLVVCPLSELGFIRISVNKKVLGAPMDEARKLLDWFLKTHSVQRIAADLPALESHPRTSDQVTDHYLADLAAKHGLKLATFDEQLKHPAVELISA